MATLPEISSRPLGGGQFLISAVGLTFMRCGGGGRPVPYVDIGISGQDPSGLRPTHSIFLRTHTKQGILPSQRRWFLAHSTHLCSQ